MGFRSWSRIIISAVIAVLLASKCTSDINSDMVIGLIGGSADFEVSDFYNRAGMNQSFRRLNKDVVIINADTMLSRDAIASAITRADAAEPKAIGVDLLFSAPRDSAADSALVNAIRRCSSPVILSAEVIERNGKYKLKDNFLTGFFPDSSFGAVNLIKAPEGGIVRSYAYSFPGEKYPIQSFASGIGLKTRPAESEPEILMYGNETFLTIEPGEIEEMARHIRNKRVIIGTVHSSEDMHLTPVSKEYPGTFIHAHATSNLLDGKFLRTSSAWLTWLLCFIFSVISSFCIVRFSDGIDTALVRVLSVAGIFMLVIAGCVLFNKFHININVLKIILSIAMTQFFIDCQEIIKTLYRKYLTVALLLLMPITAAAAYPSKFRIESIEGRAILLPGGREAKKGDVLQSGSRLDLTKCKKISLIDFTNNRVYSSSLHDKAISVSAIVQNARKSAGGVVRNAVGEVISNINTRGKTDVSTIGASQRSESDETNANTELAFTLLRQLPESASTADQTVRLIRNRISDTLLWWSIENNTDKTLKVNIVAYNQTEITILFDGDDITLAPNATTELTDAVFSGKDNLNYFLILTDSEIDYEMLADLINSKEEPLPSENFKEINVTIISE